MAVSIEYLRSRVDAEMQLETWRASRRDRSTVMARLQHGLRRALSRWRACFASDTAERAPAVPTSFVFGMCVQYDSPMLWERYYAFRMNPTDRTWRRLRGQLVPWQRGRRVVELVASTLSLNGTRMPDPELVKRALMTLPGAMPPAAGLFGNTLRTRAHRARG